MERKIVVVCTVVGILGLVAAALGFAAEAKRIKEEVATNSGGLQTEYEPMANQFVNRNGFSGSVYLPSECVYPRSPALGLGLTAAVALMVAQVIINVSTGCICCRRGPHQSNSNWTLALICFVVSWFTFVIAFLLLLTGAALNDQHGEENIYFGSYYCYVVKPGVFAGAAVLSLASVGLGILYYLTLTSTKNTNFPPWGGPTAPSQAGIVMGQPPQFPPPQTSQDPVFVHEDTYIRRQVT